MGYICTMQPDIPSWAAMPAEQRLQGSEPLLAGDTVVLMAAVSPGQLNRSRCLVRANAGSADGFTDRSRPRSDLRRSR
jgi:hypothetical protein